MGKRTVKAMAAETEALESAAAAMEGEVSSVRADGLFEKGLASIGVITALAVSEKGGISVKVHFADSGQNVMFLHSMMGSEKDLEDRAVEHLVVLRPCTDADVDSLKGQTRLDLE